jgi:lipoate-protein ligase A
MHLFETIQVLDERSRPGSAAWNMAVDQALLESADGPVLRFYRWAQPAVSFGYFLPFAGLERMARGREVVRRWTGGGIVDHGEDFTWSLIVPASHSVSRLRPVESYRAFHAAVLAALPAELGVMQVAADRPAPAAGRCMELPAPGDLLRHGKKIAGAGQRRCRHGLLHQGSICGVSPAENFPAKLAGALAASVFEFPSGGYPRVAAEVLVEQRYGTDAWLRKR